MEWKNWQHISLKSKKHLPTYSGIYVVADNHIDKAEGGGSSGSTWLTNWRYEEKEYYSTIT